MIDVIRVGREGAVKIPRHVRQALGLVAWEPLVLVTDQDTLVLKRLGHHHVRQQLHTLTRVWQRRFRQARLSPRDVTREVQATRSRR